MCAVYHGRRTGVRSDGPLAARSAPDPRPFLIALRAAQSAAKTGRYRSHDVRSAHPVLRSRLALRVSGRRPRGLGAQQCGRLDAFVQAAFAAQFTHGGDLTDLWLLASCAQAAGLDGDRLTTAIADDAVKEALRRSTEAAWEAGVRGVPTLRIGGQLFYGDDQLERARGAPVAHRCSIA
jgi:2-hydroxychromene-2-carboxylate isomerase